MPRKKPLTCHTLNFNFVVQTHSICMPNLRTPEQRGFLSGQRTRSPRRLVKVTNFRRATTEKEVLAAMSKMLPSRGVVVGPGIVPDQRRRADSAAQHAGQQRFDPLSHIHPLSFPCPAFASDNPSSSFSSSLFASHPKIDPLKFELVPFFSLSPLIGWTFASGSFSAAKWPPLL